ncbi:L1 major capsid protein [Bos taurus papillomavirus 31]|nr:L1 major capsid protein [Bos taurus papillomavirus 31]
MNWTGPTKLYLPPTQPVARVLSTDDYVIPTGYFYHGHSERLITIGHPYFPVRDIRTKEIKIPQVSANQYRSFRVKLPDPNLFAFGDPNFYDSDTTRLVWRLRALEIGRGGPLGVGSTGHPLFNKLKDTENMSGKYLEQGKDDRQSTSFDPKQVQMFIVGNRPCLGSHWDKATPCEGDNHEAITTCPPIQLVSSDIQDGDMGEIGFGNMNFHTLQEDKSSAPLDIVTQTCKWPDFLKMQSDATGDHLWFYGLRESVYARHFYCRGGVNGEEVPNAVEPSDYYLPSSVREDPRKKLATPIYFTTPSGSLNTTDSNLFNKPYFLQKAQGQNNGVCWNDEFFVTVFDNTRNINLSISVATDGPQAAYDATKFKQYLRHPEIYELTFIVQVCKVNLDGNVLAHINATNPSVIEGWKIGFVPGISTGLIDTYRNLASLATKCPVNAEAKENEDPYKDLTFWKIDCSDKLSQELDQFSLGRKFISQVLARASRSTLKRTSVKRPKSASKAPKKAKRRRT